MKTINELIKSISFGFGILTMMCLLSGRASGQKAGTLDTSFGNNGIVYGESMYDFNDGPSPIIDAKGRVLTLSFLPDGSGFVLIRCRMDGSFDPEFGSYGHVFYESAITINCNRFLVQPDDKILVAGTILHLPDTASFQKNDLFITRYLEDGSVDISFGIGGSIIMAFDKNFNTAGLALQEDGKIIVSGGTGELLWGTGNIDVALLRILPDGQPDSTFGIAGKVITDLTDSGWDIDQGGPMIIQPDGKIVVTANNGSGFNSEGFFAIMRYQANGLLDSSFATNGISIDNLSYGSVTGDIVLNGNHSILVAGKGGDVFGGGIYLTLRQYTPEGVLDPDFANGGIYKTEIDGYSRTLTDLQLQSDQKILATGWLGNNDGINLLLMRFTPRGKLDTTFASNGMAIHKFDESFFYGNKISLNPDGKIIVAGTTLNPKDMTGKVFMTRFYNDINTAIPNETVASTNEMKVYPVPIRNSLYVEFILDQPNRVNCTLYELNGHVIQNLFDQNANAGFHHLEMNITIPDGFYFLKLSSGHKQSFKKIAVMH